MQRLDADVAGLIDVGANLTHESFRNDLGEVLDRAGGCGVRRLIVTGTNLASSEAALELASSRPGVLWSTAGVHPHSAADYDDATEARLRILLRDPRVVAAGECGLDYYRNYAARDLQRTAFSRQLELAAASGRPLFLHQRDAHADFLALLAEQGPALPAGVAHCFTNGPADRTARCRSIGSAGPYRRGNGLALPPAEEHPAGSAPPAQRAGHPPRGGPDSGALHGETAGGSRGSHHEKC